jgi:hypothetical protein
MISYLKNLIYDNLLVYLLTLKLNLFNNLQEINHFVIYKCSLEAAFQVNINLTKNIQNY